VPSDDVEVSERELKMARQLIESLSTDFEPDKYHDEYRERVLALIEAKAEGQEIVAQTATEEPTQVVDLMAALEASLAAARAAKEQEGSGS
jgi:DNA end-binding protein Ku